jgi:hypothetical protein
VHDRLLTTDGFPFSPVIYLQLTITGLEKFMEEDPGAGSIAVAEIG